MPVYEYTGVNARGKKVSGVHDADNPRALRDALKAQGIFITEFSEGRDGRKGRKAGAAGSGSGGNREIELPWENRVTPQDVAMMTRQLATQQKAGIPLASCLNALVDQTEQEALKKVLSDIRQKVNEGSSLAAAMTDHPRVFSTLYVNMIRAGESSGSLDLVLLRLADFLEDQSKLRSKVVGAMVYPILMIVMATVIVGFMMVVVVPKITEVYADQGQALPFITTALITVANFVSSWRVFLLIGAIAGGVVLFRRWVATEDGRKSWDRTTLKMPLVGQLTRLVAMARFSRTLSTLLASGVPLLTALDIVKNILGNTVLVGVVEQARLNIREGESIAVPLRRSGEFPAMMTHMIAVGEQTGALEEMLDNVANTYENQVNQRVETMTALLEPVMIIVMGGTVGFIVFAIIQPILQLSQSSFGG